MRTLFFSFWRRIFFNLCFWLTHHFSNVLSGYINGQGNEEVLRSWLNLISQLAVYYITAKIECLYSQCFSDSFVGNMLLYHFSHRCFCNTHWIFIQIDTCTWSPVIWLELSLSIYVQRTYVFCFCCSTFVRHLKIFQPIAPDTCILHAKTEFATHRWWCFYAVH